MGYVILTAGLLLLMQYGREGSALTIDSSSSGIALTGQNISLVISYVALQQNTTTVSWAINGTSEVTWINGLTFLSPNYKGRLQIIGAGSLLILNALRSDSGNYTVTVTAIGEKPATRTFQVNVYDPVGNVTVTQTPQSVDEKTSVVNLACSASGDVELVTWTRKGQTLGYNDTYSLQDGNKTLQIKNPNRTFTGNYTCNMSNPLSWAEATWELTVSYTDSPATLSPGAIAGIVIGSVVGALLLIALIVLLVLCLRKRKTGNEKKKAEPQHKDALRTISGNTLSPDDPAYFTMNNIMYRNSSISMGSYIMNYNDNISDYKTPSPKLPSSPQRVKHATQV